MNFDCGAPQTGINDALSMDLTQKKLNDAKHADAHFLCTACPWCHIQFDTVQQMMISGKENEVPLASILYPQLLGLCMGMDGKPLGLDMNCLDIRGITSFIDEG